MRNLLYTRALASLGGLALILALTGCDDKKYAAATSYTVTFNTDGGTPIEPFRVDRGHTVALPTVAPQKKYGAFDLTFDGWYADPAFRNAFEFTKEPITSDVTIYARYAYPVSTEAQLEVVAQNLNGSYRLQNDITLTKDWKPLGNKDAAFTGRFDGQGYAIRNVNINPSESPVGLFGVVGASGEIRSLGVAIGGVSTANPAAGGLAGVNQGKVSGYALGGVVSGSFQVGGLVGLNEGLVYGYADGVTVKGGGSNTGGLVGYNDGKGGSVSGYVDRVTVIGGDSNAGGLVGNNNGGSVYGYVIRTTITQGAAGIGGLVGDNTGSVYGYALETVVSGFAQTGGLVGFNRSDGLSAYGSARGYTRVSVSRQSGGNALSFGLLVGYNAVAADSVKGYYSGKTPPESQFVDITVAERTGVDGVAIVVNANTQQGAFSGFDFGPASGQWTFRSGRWPAINLPAEVGGKYRPEDQPTHP